MTPNDPGWIFRPISFVAIHPYLLLTKFGKNPMKHVEEEADCEKERKKKEERKKKRQDPSKLGGIRLT